MGVRASPLITSLIDYVACWGAQNNVTFKERHY
jgi:hypothetical protein